MKTDERPHVWSSGPDPIRHKLWVQALRAKAQAHFRKEGWYIETEEYIQLWLKDDLYKQKGRRIGDLCLCRIDVDGPWSLDNIHIIPRSVHCRTMRKNNG